MASSIDQIAARRAQLAAGEPPATDAPVTPLSERIAQRRTEIDGQIFNAMSEHMPAMSLGEGEDRDAAVIRLSERFGVKPDLVERNFDTMQAEWHKSQFDPRAFREANPDLAALVARKPEMAPVVAKDLGLTTAAGDSFWLAIAGMGGGNASILRGLGKVPQIVGEHTTTPLINALFGTNFRTENFLEPIAEVVADDAEKVRGTRLSDEGKAAMADSTPTGDVLKPSTWDLGTDASVLGYLLHGAEVFGGMAPIVAASLLSGGGAAAGVGALQSGGDAAEQAREAVEKMAASGDLASESVLYNELLASGFSEKQATQRVADEAERWAFSLAGTVGAIGGKATSQVLDPAARILARSGLAGQMAGRVALGALEEGTEEVAESVATRQGISAGAGVEMDLTADTFGDFVLGGLGGGKTGALGAAGLAMQRVQARSAQRGAEILAKAKESKLAQASPQTFEDVIAEATARTGAEVRSLHFDAEPMLRLFQENNLDPEALLGPGALERIEEAQLSGGKIEVPIAQLGPLAQSPIAKQLMQLVADRADVPSAAEQQADAAETEAQAQELAKTIEQVEPTPAEAGLMALLEGDVRKAFGKKNARPNINLWRAFVRTMAVRMNVPADELFAQISVRVQRQTAQGVGAVQAVEAATPAVEVAAEAAEAAASSFSPSNEEAKEAASPLATDPASAPAAASAAQPNAAAISAAPVSAAQAETAESQEAAPKDAPPEQAPKGEADALAPTEEATLPAPDAPRVAVRVEQGGAAILYQSALSISLSRERMDPAYWHPIGATYHLDAMKRASARGDEKRAEHHLRLYERHVEAMGLDPQGPTPDAVAQDDRPMGLTDEADATADRLSRTVGRKTTNAEPAAEVPRYHEADRLLGIRESLAQRAEAFVGRRADGPVMRDGMVVFQKEGATKRRYLEETTRGYMSRRGGDFEITLTPKADFSTFLHESGHAFLEIFLDMAARPDASPQVKADAEAVLRRFGISARADLTVDHHEQWARGFEAYLMEGNAPSAELVPAFQRFTHWLKNVYRSLRNLNVEIDDEVRGVFDRLLAVDEEIAAARGEMGTDRLLFNSPEEAGMSLEEYQAYLAEREKSLSLAQRRMDLALLKERERTLDATWREEQRKLRDEAEWAYENLPARVAWLFLRGKQAIEDGTLRELANSPRLDYEAVVAVVGRERARRFLTAKVGGVSPDEAAELLGFASGSVLLAEMDALPSKKDWAKERAAEEMRAKHPGLFEDRAKLRAEIAKGLHGDATAKWLLREHAALVKKAGKGEPMPPLKVIQRAAEIVAERRTVAGLTPHIAQARERSFANKAYLAAVKGDFGRAAALKRQQVVNLYLYRALRDLREEADKAESYLRERTRDTFRREVGKASQDLLAGYDALLAAGRFGPERASLEERLDGFDRAAQVAASQANPLGEDIPALRALIAQPKPWRELSVGEARALRDAVKQIRKIAHDATEVRLENEALEIDEMISRVEADATVLRDHGPAQIAGERQKTRRKRAMERIIGAHGDLVDPEHTFDSLGETMSRFVVDRFQQAKTAKHALANEVLEPLHALWKTLPKETMQRRFEVLKDFHKRLPIPADVNLGGPADRLTLVMIALNMGNESNRMRLLGGFDWKAEQVLAYLDENLTDAEWDWVQSVWDLNDKHLWPKVAEKEQRKTGIAPEKIVATPITLRSGRVLRGGYFPAKYDPRGGVERRHDEAIAEGVAGYFDSGYRSAGTRKSHTKQRAAVYSNVVNLNWSVVPGHVAQVIHDVAMDEFVRDTAKVFEHPRMQTVFFRRLGERRAAEPRDWLKFVANQQAATAASLANDWAKAGMWAKGRLVVAAIGWSATVAMSEFSNAFVAMARSVDAGGTSYRWGLPAYVAALDPRGGFRKMALEKSAELKNRSGVESEARRRRFIAGIGKKRGKLTAAAEAVANTAFWMLEHTDKMASTQIWLARYWHEKGRGTSETEAVRLADKAVRKNLTTQDRSEQPALLRDPGSLGSLLVFYGYFAKLYNITVPGLGGTAARSVREAKRAGTAKAYGQASLEVSKMAGRYLAVMFFANVMGEWLSGRGAGEDEEPEDYLLRKMAAAPFMTIPVVGPMIGAGVESSLTDERVTISSRAPGVALAFDFMTNTGRIFDEDLEDDERIFAGIENALMAAGLPVRQPQRTLGYLRDFLNGEEDPEDALEAASGLIYGERENQPGNPLKDASGLLR